jgi:hypothetical protein
VGSKPPERITAKVSFGSAKDLPLLYAHQIVVNFTGTEFYATVYATAPDPWTTEKPPTEIVAKPLARFAFPPAFWLAFVESATDQAKKLEAEGAFSEELKSAVNRALGR